jgi:hypothetical protein
VLTPLIDYVTQVSSVAGISFVGQVAPFLPLLTKGMDLIAGQTGDTALEVAVDTDMRLSKSGYFAIVAAPKTEIDGKAVTIDPQDRKLLVNGTPLQRGYCVFSIRRAEQKADYGEIPELKQAYAALQAAIVANDVKRAREALAAFRLATVVSPDLITADATRLVKKAEGKIAAAFPGGGVSVGLAARRPEALATIGLYD